MKIYRVTWEEICSVEICEGTKEEAMNRILNSSLRRDLEENISKEPMEQSFEVEEVAT